MTSLPLLTGSADRRRAFALLLVLFAIAIVTLVLVSLQASAFRQAAMGREAVARTRAHWAARAGLEATIARLAYNVENANTGNAFTIEDDMRDVASGNLERATWEIRHEFDERESWGPLDPHAKVNINRMTRDDLMELPLMTEDVADAILDWIDEDDVPNEFGIETGFYEQLPSPYTPRNAPIRNLLEIELVYGVDPFDLRGEDWNLNNRLDPNEDDGDLTFPPDNADGVLDAGWSGYITAQSVDESMAVSGEARLSVPESTADQLVARIPSLNQAQADIIVQFSQQENVRPIDLLAQPLTQIAQSFAQPGQPPSPQLTDLTIDQVETILDELTFHLPDDPPTPGRVNLNTCSRETLDYVTSIQPGVADFLILERNARATGFAHILDLLDVPGITESGLVELSRYLDVQSNAWVVISRGRDEATGIEVEIVATIERSTLPIVITEYVVR